jgi:hypothetical protein
VSDELIKLYLWNIIWTYRVICKLNIFIPQINAIYLTHPLTAFHYSINKCNIFNPSLNSISLFHGQHGFGPYAEFWYSNYDKQKKPAECTADPGYNNIGLCDTCYVASYILW